MDNRKYSQEELEKIITEENLLNKRRTGSSFILSNNRVCPKFIFHNELDGQELELWFDKKNSEFKVYFEGAFLSITKTFPPLLKKAEQIIKEFNLELKTIVNSENDEPLILVNEESDKIYIDPIKIDIFSFPEGKLHFTTPAIKSNKKN